MKAKVLNERFHMSNGASEKSRASAKTVENENQTVKATVRNPNASIGIFFESREIMKPTSVASAMISA